MDGWRAFVKVLIRSLKISTLHDELLKVARMKNNVCQLAGSGKGLDSGEGITIFGGIIIPWMWRQIGAFI